jgi:hypothetical protein
MRGSIAIRLDKRTREERLQEKRARGRRALEDRIEEQSSAKMNSAPIVTTVPMPVNPVSANNGLQPPTSVEEPERNPLGSTLRDQTDMGRMGKIQELKVGILSRQTRCGS